MDKLTLYPSIKVARNDDMNAWDVMVLIGGFPDEASARKATDALASVLNEKFDANFSAVN